MCRFKALGLVAMLVALSAAANATQDDAQIIRNKIFSAYKSFSERDIAAAQSIYLRSDRLIVYDLLPTAKTNDTGYAQVVGGAKAASMDGMSGREVGFDALYRKVEQQAASTKGPMKFSITDLDVTVDHNHAYSRYIGRVDSTLKSGQPVSVVFRTTDVWERVDGDWFIVLEHASFPPG
jgi:SnoaL-like domain